jgi:hypothetical protein
MLKVSSQQISPLSDSQCKILKTLMLTDFKTYATPQNLVNVQKLYERINRQPPKAMCDSFNSAIDEYNKSVLPAPSRVLKSGPKSLPKLVWKEGKKEADFHEAIIRLLHRSHHEVSEEKRILKQDLAQSTLEEPYLKNLFKEVSGLTQDESVHVQKSLYHLGFPRMTWKQDIKEGFFTLRNILVGHIMTLHNSGHTGSLLVYPVAFVGLTLVGQQFAGYYDALKKFKKWSWKKKAEQMGFGSTQFASQQALPATGRVQASPSAFASPDFQRNSVTPAAAM